MPGIVQNMLPFGTSQVHVFHKHHLLISSVGSAIFIFMFLNYMSYTAAGSHSPNANPSHDPAGELWCLPSSNEVCLKDFQWSFLYLFLSFRLQGMHDGYMLVGFLQLQMSRFALVFASCFSFLSIDKAPVSLVWHNSSTLYEFMYIFRYVHFQILIFCDKVGSRPLSVPFF